MAEVDELNASAQVIPSKRLEGILSAISVGVFFLLVGVIFVVNSSPNQPNLLDRIIDFLTHFDITQVNNLGVYLPAPTSPLRHSTVYLATEQFSFVWGLFQVIILALRFAARSPLSKKAETVSNFVFWIGASFLISNFLLDTRWTQVYRASPNPAMTVWFVFWSMIIMLLGFSIIIRAIVLAAAPKRHVI
jgi:hypothetical protein